MVVAQYIYRNGLSPVAVLDGTGTLLARFIYASHPNTPDFMVIGSGTVFKYINDERGSPRLIVNAATGAVAQILQYDEFGIRTVISDLNEFPLETQPFGFAGGLRDSDTGLVRFGARDYEPQTGRWLAKDPALFGGAQTNFYVYVGNDPINRRDPSGLFSAFGWRGISAPFVELGPVDGVVEGVGIVGYDFSTSSAFGSAIAGVGGEAGPVEVVGGKEWTTPLSGSSATSNGIVLFGGNFPVGGVFEGALGFYRTTSGEWGWYGGAGVGAEGFHSSWGVGTSLPSFKWLESKLAAAKRVCGIK